MRTVVKGKNIDVSEADRRHAEDKMRRLERLLDERSEALVELSLERHRSLEVSHIVEVTLVVDGRPLRGEAAAATFRSAVDQVIDKLERQAVDLKERPRERERSSDKRARGEGDGPGRERSARAPARCASSRPSASPSSPCSRRTR